MEALKNAMKTWNEFQRGEKNTQDLILIGEAYP
jgi:hypothetical protein